MPRSSTLLLSIFLFLCIHLSHAKPRPVAGTPDGSEQWGYCRVRPKAHMFWWLYRSPQRVENASSPWPTVMWLQGGPGASGVGIGNFGEIGPLDTDLQPRNSTWLQKADLLFVDNPVGTGYSFFEGGEDLLVKTDEEAASDLTQLLKKLYNRNKKLQRSPLYIVAESYGGKYAVTLGLSIVKAINAGKLKLKFGGVALGGSWISPEDSVSSWGPVLNDISRIDENGLKEANSLAETIKQNLEKEQYMNATESWMALETLISKRSNDVDFYNFLNDYGRGSSSSVNNKLSDRISAKRYLQYLTSKTYAQLSGGDLMDTVIRKKLKIIPKDVSWGGQSDQVFLALQNDFMKPRINEVDELLSKGVNVVVYNGQLDLICATKGTEAWVQKLKWEGLEKFTNSERTPIYCGGDGATKGFVKSYKNLHFYWILGSGHFVPVDQPCTALKMLDEILQLPALEASVP